VHIAVSGSTGLIGTTLTARLESLGHDVTRLVRGEHWDPAAGRGPDLTGVDAVVNLSGAGIGGHRWTEDYKRTLVQSRLTTTTVLAEAIASTPDGPGVFLSASAIGFYGDRDDELLNETSPAGDGFLPDLVEQWEAATAPATEAGARVATMRSGIVLAPDGGALKKMLPLFKLGVGGRFGSGRQWMSWISIDDEIGAIVHLLDQDVSGPVNLTAPVPVRNREFAATLGRVLHRPARVPVPAFGPKLLLGAELADALLFESQRVDPAVLAGTGYQFEHPDLATALAAVLGRG
jgi:uncharacterized protein (TIGR01777 family)